MSTPKDLELKIFVVTQRETGEKSYQAAITAEDACKQAGWLIGDCFVVAQKPRKQHGKKQEPQTRVLIPCDVCPFQYAECKKPPAEACPVQPDAPELQEWLKQASQAHLCGFIGNELTKKNYHLRQKWLPLPEASKELSRQSPPPTQNPSEKACQAPLDTR